MPNFTAIALDRLLEPGAPESSAATVSDTGVDRRRGGTPIRVDRGVNSASSMVDRGVSVPPRLEKGTNVVSAKIDSKNGRSDASVGRNYHWTQISPALYATPKSTPIPDSPSSFPPSPYVINHKRRGPRLLKSYSEVDVSTSQRVVDKGTVNDRGKNSETKATTADDSSILRRVVSFASADFSRPAFPSPGQEKEQNDSSDSVLEVHVNGSFTTDNQVNGTLDFANNGNVNAHFVRDPQACKTIQNSANQINNGKTVSFSFQVGDFDESLDPLDSVSEKSNTEFDAVGGVEQSTNWPTQTAEFYDAWEELSSENGPQQQPVPDIETELRDIRLSLLMEIEKRKQAEESFKIMCTHWQKFRSQLSSVGLTLLADPLAVRENEQLEECAEDLSQQVYVARFVSNSIARGIAKAEVEMEMEAQLEYKNFEISRLSDRLRYYEAVNREMSQRNQEAVDNARRLRQRQKRRKKWVWASVAAAITIGSAVLAWSYIPTGKGTPSSSPSHASDERDHPSQS